jgi:DNA polymerase-3 subunit epsilon
MPRWFEFWKKPEHGAIPPETPIDSLRYVVFDTELTSLNKRSNRLLSVGAIAMDGLKIRLGQQFYRVVNPGVDVPAQGVLIHKLRPADIENGESPEQVLADLQQFMHGAVLVGQFVGIDVDILKKELGEMSHTLDHAALDTARVHKWLLRQQQYSEDLVHKLENVDLVSLAKAYNLEIQEAHHALDDAFLTARIWQKMLVSLQRNDVRTFGELMRIGRI